MPVNSVASFFIETHGISLNEKNISVLGINIHIISCNTDFPLLLVLLGPAHKPLKFEILASNQSGYQVSFKPFEVGDHLLDVKIDDEPINNCPFLIKVYDANRVVVSEPTGGVLGKPVFFSSKPFKFY